MSTVSQEREAATEPGRHALPLVNGERMRQPEFHRRYLTRPEGEKWELIGGIVYMASPLRRPHGVYHPALSGAFWWYAGATPGTEVLDNTTTILGEEKEPQPDLELRVLASHGGRSQETPDSYVFGPPELVAEIAHSTRDIDLHEKRIDYETAGVREYLVLCIEERELRWFDFRAGQPLRPTRQGIYRSRVYPGLWIDGRALLDRDSRQLIAVVQHGLASPEHARFVRRLEVERRKRSPK